MIQVEKLLFPTDFSEASNHALPHALEMVRKFQSEIIMIHVRTPFSGDPDQPEQQFFDDGKYEEYVERELEKRSRNVGDEDRVRTVVRHNISAASSILEFVEEESIDMIVMGTHGRSALSHFFLGSVAERVVRHSRVPVLTVAPAKPGYRVNPSYEKVLATFDFSEHSRRAAQRAQGVAERFGAHLQVLYVVEQEILPGYYETWRASISENLPEIAEEARKSLTEVLGQDGLEDVEIRVEVGSGDGKVYHEIAQFAQAQEVDLIVMGTHGLSGFEHMLLGSTTERLVRIAPCPVLTFH
jgi:nucleotide-binding universal stress UspA family protein